jgi:catechol 2,3-dioxygenase-like lactoylglutathione lyase family enzyme
MTLKLNHLHIKTRDPEKAVRFYVDTFGATVVNKSPRGGDRLDLLGLLRFLMGSVGAFPGCASR